MSLVWKPRLKVYQGSNRKNVFNPETNEATSYNWWVYVKKIKGHWVFNDYNYSVTTNGHQGEMKAFLRETIGVKNLIFVDQRESLSHGLFLDSKYETLAIAEVRLKAKNRREAFYNEQREIIAKCKKDIAILRKLGAKANRTLVNYRVNAKESEAQRLESQREKSRIARAARAAVVTEFKAAYESTSAVEV